MWPISMRHKSLKNSSLFAAPLDLFSALTQASYCPTDRGFAHPQPQHREQELGPLGVCSPGSLLEVFSEQLLRLLVEHWLLAGSFLRLQSAVLVELLAVAFDRGAVDP